jgi:dTDP-4-dehydrorhamnose reductase
VKVLLFGGRGLLGTAFHQTIPSGTTIVAPPRAEVDVRDEAAVVGTIERLRPDWIIDCAALTAVDDAEEREAEAAAVNSVAVAQLGRLAAAHGTRVLLPSTDYVFDGASSRPYREDDETRPLSVYARSKRDGEVALQASGARALIIRSGWLYGRGGKNFPATLWQRALSRTPATVVSDQVGTPTSTLDLARWSWQLVALGVEGIVHATATGHASWFDVAREVYAAAGWADGVTPTTTAAFAARASRPAYSVLDCARFDSLVPGARRPWRAGLSEYLRHLAAERAA